MYSHKYIFQFALKCETKKNLFLKIKKSDWARFSGTGGDNHQLFFLCGLIRVDFDESKVSYTTEGNPSINPTTSVSISSYSG
jgi:hypothetical protein